MDIFNEMSTDTRLLLAIVIALAVGAFLMGPRFSAIGKFFGVVIVAGSIIILVNVIHLPVTIPSVLISFIVSALVLMAGASIFASRQKLLDGYSIVGGLMIILAAATLWVQIQGAILLPTGTWGEIIVTGFRAVINTLNTGTSAIMK